MKIFNVVAVTLLGLSAGVVNASTIFMPTGGNVNFTALSSFNDQLATFANAADLLVGNNPVNITFGNPYTIFGNSLKSGTLALTSDFVVGLGVNTGSGISWLADTGFSGSSAAGNLSFISSNSSTNILLNNAQVQVVPLPAAIWLFGSGLLGLCGVVRRKT